jgi:hypothetical protein
MDNTGFLVIALLVVVGFGGVFLMFMLSNIREERMFKERLQDLCSRKNCTLTIQPEPKVSYRIDGTTDGRKWVLKNYTHSEDAKFTKGPADSDLVFTADGLTNSVKFVLTDKISTDTLEGIASFAKKVSDSAVPGEITKMQPVPLGLSEEFRNEFNTYAAAGAPVADVVDSDVQKLMLRYRPDLAKPNFAIASVTGCLIVRSNSTYTMSELEAVLSTGEEILKRMK